MDAMCVPHCNLLLSPDGSSMNHSGNNRYGTCLAFLDSCVFVLFGRAVRHKAMGMDTARLASLPQNAEKHIDLHVQCMKISSLLFISKTHTHTHTHTLTLSRTHARTHSRTHARTHALTHARTHAFTHSLTHAPTHARTYARTRAPTYFHPRTRTDRRQEDHLCCNLKSLSPEKIETVYQNN